MLSKTVQTSSCDLKPTDPVASVGPYSELIVVLQQVDKIRVTARSDQIPCEAHAGLLVLPRDLTYKLKNLSLAQWPNYKIYRL